MDVYLIDGNSYLYRAYYAIRGLSDSKGRPTNVIFGFTNMLMKIIRDLKPGGLAVSFDTPHRTDRHRLYEEYKAHRPDTPDDLIRQIPDVRRVLEAFRIKLYEVPGFEADDVLATLSEKLSGEGQNVFIITADKDMLQLVSDGIRVYDPMKNAVLGYQYVLERFGVPPEKIPEYMALVGDPVDNIPGVKGIGEKTARELFAEFGSLAGILARAGEIKKERTRRLITEGLPDISMSLELARIRKDAPVEVDMEEIALREPDWRTLLGIFKEFEFTSLMKLVPGESLPAKRYQAVLDMPDIENLARGIKENVALTLYPDSPSLVRCGVAGLALSTGEDCYYLPFAHNYLGAPEQPDCAEVLELLRPAFEDESVAKTGHNLKQAVLMLDEAGVRLGGMLYDTMLASHLLNPLRAEHGLEAVALEHLGVKKVTVEEAAGKGRGVRDLSVEDAAGFACQEIGLVRDLKVPLFNRLEEEGLARAYFEFEMPLVRVLARMEEAGVKVDPEKLAGFSKELERELDAIQRRIYFLAGCEFNVNSPRQLGHVLFDQLGLKPGKKKKTGYSTDVGVLEELALVHELPQEVLNWRALYKLKCTYVDVLPGLVNPKTGRIHTSFNQAATATGRLSSTEPNLQNIPVRGDWGRRVREAFIPEEGNLIISADYSQIELRVLAHLSGDETLKRLFEEGTDIHAGTAAELFGVKPSEVTPAQRRIAKGVNFGVVYGITPFGLSEAIGVDKGTAALYIERYFERHPGVKKYIEKVIEDAKRDGFVRTMSGRKRPVPEIKSRDARVRSLGERLAMNSPVQGSAADIIKKAMIDLSKKFEGTGTKLILQVHDELVFEAPAAGAEEAKEAVRAGMERAVSLDVPVVVDAGAGRNWAEAH